MRSQLTNRSNLKLHCGRGSVSWRLKRGRALRGYVTEGSKPAREFHKSDFNWQELYDRVGLQLEQRPTMEWDEQVGLLKRVESGGWDVFYERHGRPRFFKERRYLTLEFPALLQQEPPIRVLDFGCGYGSSILPLLKVNGSCSCLGVDVSQVALRALRTTAADLGIETDQLRTEFLDMTHSEAAVSLIPFRANYALMIFALSAVDPADMKSALETAYLSLEAGGKLLFRDYGFCDMSQIRYSSQQTFSSQAYLRQDGTRAYYFKQEELQSMVVSCGFRVEECGYVCLSQINRKTGQELKRVFVHGIFVRG